MELEKSMDKLSLEYYSDLLKMIKHASKIEPDPPIIVNDPIPPRKLDMWQLLFNRPLRFKPITEQGENNGSTPKEARSTKEH